MRQYVIRLLETLLHSSSSKSILDMVYVTVNVFILILVCVEEEKIKQH